MERITQTLQMRQPFTSVYNTFTELYKKQFGAAPPKYLKYISIAFAGLGLWMLRNIFWKIHNKLKSYPSGPLGLPFVGCFVQFAGTPHTFLVNIANQYGAITFVPLMASNNLFISDHKVLKQLYMGEKIIDRPAFRTRPFHLNCSPIQEVNGDVWIQRRSYASTTVKAICNSGFVLKGVNKCIDNVEKQFDEKYVGNKELWFPHSFTHFISFNNIWSAVFDDTFPFNDPYVAKYCEAADTLLFNAGRLNLLLDLAFNFMFDPAFVRWHTVDKHFEKCQDLLLDWMRKNGFIVNPEKNVMQRNDSPSGSALKASKIYIEAVMDGLKQNKVTVNQILGDIIFITGAALDTTSKSAEYGFILLAKYPDIQQQVYEEVMKVKGDNQFELKMVNEMHILRAFIHEFLRISCVVPTGGVPHMTKKDHIIKINEGGKEKKVVIPKNTMLHSNTLFMQKYVDWSTGKTLDAENNDIHLEYWMQGDRFKVNERFILFGVGRRDCVGQQLAMKVLYATFASMMIKYRFVAPNNDPDSIDIHQKWGNVVAIDPSIGIVMQKR